MICGAVLTLVPEGGAKRSLRLICGFVLLYALISVGTDDLGSGYSEQLAAYREKAFALTENAEEEKNRMERQIIEAECEAYILDKGTELGISNLEVAVELKWSMDGYWYPVSAEIVSGGTEQQNDRLRQYIEGDLGIDSTQQIWKGVP